MQTCQMKKYIILRSILLGRKADRALPLLQKVTGSSAMRGDASKSDQRAFRARLDGKGHLASSMTSRAMPLRGNGVQAWKSLHRRATGQLKRLHAAAECRLPETPASVVTTATPRSRDLQHSRPDASNQPIPVTEHADLNDSRTLAPPNLPTPPPPKYLESSSTRVRHQAVFFMTLSSRAHNENSSTSGIKQKLRLPWPRRTMELGTTPRCAMQVFRTESPNS